jgi:hypothetical protein
LIGMSSRSGARTAVRTGALYRGPIHDSACGEGRIVKTAWRAGYEATGSDLEDRGFGETGIDFREDFRPRVALVFNSPSGLQEVFIVHALDVATEAVAVIVPIPFVCAQDRYRDLLEALPAFVHPRVFAASFDAARWHGCPRKGDTTDYAWFIWSRRRLRRQRNCRRIANGW